MFATGATYDEEKVVGTGGGGSDVWNGWGGAGNEVCCGWGEG